MLICPQGTHEHPKMDILLLCLSTWWRTDTPMIHRRHITHQRAARHSLHGSFSICMLTARDITTLSQQRLLFGLEGLLLTHTALHARIHG